MFSLSVSNSHTSSSIRLDIHKRFSHKSSGIHVVVQFTNDPIISAGDGNGGFVALHLTDAVKLGHPVSFFHVPYKQNTKRPSHHSADLNRVNCVLKNNQKHVCSCSLPFLHRHLCNTLADIRQLELQDRSWHSWILKKRTTERQQISTIPCRTIVIFSNKMLKPTVARLETSVLM